MYLCPESSSLDCAAGTYGSGCAETCSERCAGDNNPCDQSDGACSRGCDPGYVGTHCENGETKVYHRTIYYFIVPHIGLLLLLLT